MQSNIRIIELLRFLYQQTDEAHAVTVSEMIEYLKSKGIPSVRQTVYTDLEALDTAGIDIVQIKSTQNRYFIGSRIFEYPELKMLVDAVASSKVISAKKSQALIQKLGQLTSIQQAEQLQRLASLSSRVKPHNEKVYYIIDSIQTAILDQHQISFQYNEYTPEKKKILKHDGYLYCFFGAQSGDAEKAMNEYEDQLECSGFVTTACILFPDMEDEMSFEDFFSLIGVDDYEYLGEDTTAAGWLRFMYNGMEVMVNTNEAASGGGWNFTGVEIVKHNAPVSIVDTEIFNTNQDLADAVMFD